MVPILAGQHPPAAALSVIFWYNIYLVKIQAASLRLTREQDN